MPDETRSIAAAPGGMEAGEVYLERAREFAPILADAGAEIERCRELPPGIVDGMIERGFFRMLLPRSLDGAELLPLPYVRVVEEIAKGDASAAWCLNQGCGCSMTTAYLGAEAAREIFAGPRGVLAWGPGPGEARAVPGGYRVTATWSFASGSHNASWLGCHVPVVEADGTTRRRSDGSPAIYTMLLPKEAARMTDIWHVVGLRGTGSDRFAVKDLFVPEAHATRREEGEPREPGLLYRFSSLHLYSSGFGAVAMGIARATLDAFIALARDKIPRGAKKTLRDNNVIQSQVAQAEAKLAAARCYLHNSLGEITERVACRGHLTLDERMAIRLASTFAIHQAREVVDAAYHAAGATAIFTDNPFERRFRDIHTVSQQLQGRQEHFETVGQHLLGLAADTMWL